MIKLVNIASKIASFAPINIIAGFCSLIKISGANGVGKTSLIKIICGLSDNYSGKVFINNYDLKYNKEEFKRNTQILFAQNGLYEDLTVKQNLQIWSKRWSGIDLTNAGVAVFSLEKYNNSIINTLSSGFKRKIALSRLIVCPANIWIIDEIDSYLDSESLGLLKNIIIQRVKNNGIIFYTSHSDYLDDIKNHEIYLQ